MKLWAIGAVTMLAVGVTLIGIGWHGSRVDRHPLCDRCGFDLIGSRRWETRECPECGSDVSGLAVRVGHRACRPRPLYCGLTLTLPSLLVVGSMIYVYVRDVDVTPHKPAWWLVYELGWDSATEAVSFNELATRMQSGQLPDHYVAGVAEHFLERQRSIDVEWNSSWSAFIESAHSAGKLSKEQWSRYAEQGFTVQSYALWGVRGKSVAMAASVIQSRHTPQPGFVSRLELRDVRVDGELVVADAALPFFAVGQPHVTRRGPRQRTERLLAQIAGESTRALPTGTHDLSATAVLTIRQGDEFGDVVATRRTELRSSFRIEEESVRSPRAPRVTEITVR